MSIRELDLPAYNQPLRPALYGFAALITFAAILILWGTLAPVSGAAIAYGQLQAEGNRRSVQHPFGGVVRTIAVKEGDVVAQGQELVVLDDDQPRADLAVLQAQSDGLLMARSRLSAERDNAASFALPQELAGRAGDETVKLLMGNEQALMAARNSERDAQLGILARQKAQLQAQADAYEAQRSGSDRQRQLLNQDLAAAQQLLQKGNATRVRVRALQSDLAKLDADTSALGAEIARAQEALSQADLALAQYQRQRVAQVTGELNDAQNKLAEISPKLAEAQDRLNRTRITAPVSGTVVGLNVFTVGGVIAAGATLMEIVPKDEALVAHGRLHLTDVNDVKAGDVADIRLSSVDRNERPEIKGRIRTISADSVSDPSTGEGYYLVDADLDAADAAKARSVLRSGLPVEIITPTKSRTLAGYLLGPLLDEISLSFREH